MERDYGEACDDGNLRNRDGCSSACKVDNGWSCQVVNLFNRSFCSIRSNKDGYCGNGKLEEGEQCDDGFPLKNWDGCDVKCQIEKG